MTKSQIPIWIMAGLSVLVALATFRVIPLGLSLSFAEMLGHLDQRWWAFVLHIWGASAALGLGSVQFFAGFRAKHLGIHRWIGRLYAISILIAGVAGFIVALGAEGGIIASVGFGLLAILWLSVTFNAVRLARARRIAEHKRWMIRSFALTFAAVTLRLYLLGFMGAGFTYTEASVYLAWMCWVPNLIIVEWLLRRTRGARGT